MTEYPSHTRETAQRCQYSGLDPYGFCPICYRVGTLRERRPNGNDQCFGGHTYPSKDALSALQVPAATPQTQTDISREAVELLPCKLCGGGFTSYHAFGEQVWQHVGLANCLLKGHVLKIGSLMATWNRFMSSEAQSQRIAELEGALSAAQTDRAQMYDALTLSLSKGVEMKAQLSAAREAEHDANGVADANIKRADSAEAQLTTIATKAAKAMQEEAARKVRDFATVANNTVSAALLHSLTEHIRAINVDAIVEKVTHD